MDQDLIEEIGGKPSMSEDARHLLEGSLKTLFGAFKKRKENDMAKVWVRMKESHIFSGQGRGLTKGTTFQVHEKDLKRIQQETGGKLEVVSAPGAKKPDGMSAITDRKDQKKVAVTKEK